MTQEANAIRAIEDFDDWVWCQCSECRSDARSHAVDTRSSLVAIADAVKAALRPEGGQIDGTTT